MSKKLNTLLLKEITRAGYSYRQFAKVLQSTYFQDKSLHNMYVQVKGLESDMSYKYIFYARAFEILGLSPVIRFVDKELGHGYEFPHDAALYRRDKDLSLKKCGALFGVTGQTYAKLEDESMMYECRVKYITDKFKILCYHLN